MKKGGRDKGEIREQGWKRKTEKGKKTRRRTSGRVKGDYEGKKGEKGTDEGGKERRS